MTTGEFIKILQKEDPSGTSHIRISGGIPYSAELKAGYWDGPYSYLDEDGNYVYTTEDSKVDVYCIDIWDFVERHINIDDSNNWKTIEGKFKFKLGYSVSAHVNERIDGIMKEAREAFDQITEIHENSYNHYFQEAIEHSEKGWTWFQNKDVDKNERPNYHKYYTWKIFDEDGKPQSSNVSNTESIMKSGLWEKLDNGVKEGYYQWIKK